MDWPIGFPLSSPSTKDKFGTAARTPKSDAKNSPPPTKEAGGNNHGSNSSWTSGSTMAATPKPSKK